MNLQNSKVLITGGNSGIGKATAQLLKQKGAQVVIVGRNQQTLATTGKDLGMHAIQADVSDEKQVTRMIRQAIEHLQGLDVLINNAGYGYTAPLTEIESHKFEDVLRTNVVGAAICAREAARHFIQQQSGNIINIASTAALRGSPNSSPYVATKFALRGMTESWRYELRQHNIRVMLVNPSEVMTNFATNRLAIDSKTRKVYTEAERRSKLRAEEVAQAICSILEMDDRGFVPEITIFATNPQQ